MKNIVLNDSIIFYNYIRKFNGNKTVPNKIIYDKDNYTFELCNVVEKGLFKYQRQLKHIKYISTKSINFYKSLKYNSPLIVYQEYLLAILKFVFLLEVLFSFQQSYHLHLFQLP